MPRTSSSVVTFGFPPSRASPVRTRPVCEVSLRRPRGVGRCVLMCRSRSPGAGRRDRRVRPDRPESVFFFYYHTSDPLSVYVTYKHVRARARRTRPGNARDTFVTSSGPGAPRRERRYASRLRYNSPFFSLPLPDDPSRFHANRVDRT